ncbi:MAG: aldolase [Verrucomicrobia bacterium]|nr:aldolase [Verrucomicrobiota bacterium]
MKLRPSRLLRELRSGTSCATAKINLSDPRIIELCGLAGMSAVWICNEHVGNDWFNIENQVRAAKLYDMDTIVRVAKGSYSDYVKPFEADATAIMVPHVATAEEARHVVEMTRFYPLGRRALDGGNVDGVYCQVPLADYIRHSNTERVLILQIESPQALEQVHEIAAVPGFDILLFGPGDFSHLLGKPGQINDPVVVDARKRVAAAAKAHGKFAMSAGVFGSQTTLEAEGYRAFNIGADVIGVGQYFKERMAEFKNHIPHLAGRSVYQ